MEPIRTTTPRLLRLLTRLGGNRAAISRATGWSLNTVRRLLREHGLERIADEHALRSRRSGPRRQASAEAIDSERQRISQALQQRTDAEAAAALGMPIATFYRRLAAYGLTSRSTTGSAWDPG